MNMYINQVCEREGCRRETYCEYLPGEIITTYSQMISVHLPIPRKKKKKVQCYQNFTFLTEKKKKEAWFLSQ